MPIGRRGRDRHAQLPAERLLNAQLLNPPKVIFSTLLPKELVTELKALVQRHHGMVVLRPEEATHEIIPDLPQDDEEVMAFMRRMEAISKRAAQAQA